LQQKFNEEIIKADLKTDMSVYLLRTNSLFIVKFSS